MNKRPINFKIFSILIIIFVSGLISQWFLFEGGQTSEKVRISQTVANPIYNYNESFSRDIEIVKPINAPQTKLPVVIMLHGSFGNYRTMNFMKLEFLRNNYIVVVTEISYFSYRLYFELNATLDYMLQRSDVDPDKIGLFGQSYGAHIATIFGCMRNDSINVVVCMNFGSMDYFYTDYYDYYRTYVLQNVSLPYSYGSYSDMGYELPLPMTSTNPNNLLLVSDVWDDRPTPPLEDYLHNFTSGLYNESNKFYGNFEDGTARKLYVSSTILGHGSGTLYPEAMYEQINWMNQALKTGSNASNILLIGFNLVYGISITIFLFVIALAIVVGIITLLPQQGVYLKNFYKKLKDKLRASEEDVVVKEKKIEEIIENVRKKDIELIDSKFIKKIIIALISINVFIILFKYFRDSSGLWEEFYQIENLPFRMIEFFGFNSYTILFSSDDFPADHMFFWFIFSIIMLEIISRRYRDGLDKSNDYTIRNFFFDVFIGIEIFVIITFFSRISIFFIVGDVLQTIYFSNIIFAISLLYLLNRLAVIFQEKYLNDSKKYLKEVLINLAVFLIPFIPTLVGSVIYYINYQQLYNSTSYYLRILAGSIVLALCNPILRRKNINILSITFANYFSLLLIWTFFSTFF